MILAVNWGAVLIGFGAVLSGLGGLLSGLAALRLARREKPDKEEEEKVESHESP